jgi:hypothetical protein
MRPWADVGPSGRAPRSVLQKKSQAGKELANASQGAYLWGVANSDRVRATDSLIG